MVFREMAQAVLEERYLLPGEKPEDLFWRVARYLAEDEKEAREFFELMASLEFLPNSPTLRNAGANQGTLSACFVLPIGDSLKEIFETLGNAAEIQKYGGGTGYDFSVLRPSGSTVRTTLGKSCGPLGFMKSFDLTIGEVIAQGGVRHGAQMGILNVHHPDILEFIKAKDQEGELKNFNLSVAITDRFIEAVEKDEVHLVQDWTDPDLPEKPLVPFKKNGREVSAREIWDLIAYQAWKNGEPGLVFLDEINRKNPTPHLGKITATNPCGEQPLLPYESCNLGSINLAKITSGGRIDWERLKKTVRTAVRLLNRVIDKNRYALPQIEEMTKKTRKIGLGVMGFADLLLILGIRYDSEEAVHLAEEVMEFVNLHSTLESVELAKKYGPFPAYREETMVKLVHPEAVPYLKEHGIRNATTTTIAPTGTISTIAGCSSGIEPVFSWEYRRNILGKTFIDRHPLYETWLKEHPGEPLPRYFVTAREISPEWHVRIQAAFQKWTHNAVSKTINLPHEATVEDVKKAYELAYKLGCKGITVYRDGSRQVQVIQDSKEQRKEGQRPDVLEGKTYRVRMACGNMYVTVNLHPDTKKPFEVFATIGPSGSCGRALAEALTKTVSHALRSGVPLELIIKSLKGIKCDKPSWGNGQVIYSCPDAIARVLEGYASSEVRVSNPGHGERCPECGEQLIPQSGCWLCPACGFEKCG